MSNANETKTGWMLFCATKPIGGLDPYPAYTPSRPERAGLDGWIEYYSIFASREDAESEAIEDLETERNYVDVEDLAQFNKELAIAYKVRVDMNGRLEIFATDTDEVPFKVYDAAKISRVFDVDWPAEPLPVRP